MFKIHVTTNPPHRYALIRHIGVPALACAFNPKQKTELLISCQDSLIRCLDIETQTLVSTLKGHESPPFSISFQKHGHLVLTAASDSVILWDTRDWTRFRTLNAGPGAQHAMFTGEKSRLIAVLFRDNAVMVWNLDSFQVKCRLALPDDDESTELTHFAVSSDELTVVAGGRGSYLYVWETESQQLIRIIDLPSNIKATSALDFLPGTTTMCSNTISLLGDEGRISFINISAQKPIINLQISADPKGIVSYAMDATGKYVVSGTSDGCLLLHDFEIARDFARTVQETRKSNGIPPFDEEVKLATRSAFGLHPTSTSTTVPSRKSKAKHATSLYHLAQLTESESLVNQKRLEMLLSSYGEYPSKYRLLIWRFLLRLPENNSAFVALLSKGEHPSFTRLQEKYPIQSQRLFRRLLRIVSAIAHWCPVFGEVPYLAALVFPFVKICATDDLTAFEMSLSVLLHWGKDWLQTFPHPPLRLLTVFEDHLAEHDPQLHEHFKQHQVTAQTYAWSLVRTLFTEILTRDEWMRLWDHLFTKASDPTLLYVAVYAYLQYFRTVILSASDAMSIDAIFHRQNAINMNSYLNLFYKLKDGGAFDILLQPSQQEIDVDGNVISTDKSKVQIALWPLPQGQYPVFSNYPKYVVDFQLQERERIVIEENELLQKRQILQDLEERTEKLRLEHEQWSQQQEKLIRAEEERRLKAAGEEKQRLSELRHVEDQTRKRRLAQIAEMEKSAQETLHQTSRIRELEYLRLQDQLKLQKEREEYELESRKEEEKLLGMEFEAAQRVKELEAERLAEERARGLRKEFETKVQSEKLRDKVRQDKWRLEDEERRLKLRLEAEAKQKLTMLTKELEIQRKMEHEFMERAVDKEAKLLALQKERRLRQMEEEGKSRLEHAMEVRRHEEERMMREEYRKTKEEAEKMLQHEKEKTMRRAAVLQNEQRQQALELEAREAQVIEMKRREDQLMFQKKMEKKQKEILHDDDEEEQKTEDLVVKMDEERRKRLVMEREIEPKRYSIEKIKDEEEEEGDDLMAKDLSSSDESQKSDDESLEQLPLSDTDEEGGAKVTIAELLATSEEEEEEGDGIESSRDDDSDVEDFMQEARKVLQQHRSRQ